MSDSSQCRWHQAHPRSSIVPLLLWLVLLSLVSCKLPNFIGSPALGRSESRVARHNGAKSGRRFRKKAPRDSKPFQGHLPYGEPHAWKVEQIERLPLIAECKSDKATAATAKNLTNEDVEVRRAAVKQILNKGVVDRVADVKILDALLKSLYDSDPEVRMIAAAVFTKLMTTDHDSDETDYWAMDAWIARIVEKIRHHSTSGAMEKILSLEALERIGKWQLKDQPGLRDLEPYVASCAFCLEDEDPGVRFAAIKAIAGMNLYACRQALAKRQMHDEVMEIREAADRVLRMRPFVLEESLPYLRYLHDHSGRERKRLKRKAKGKSDKAKPKFPAR